MIGWDGTLLVLVGLATLVLGTVAALIQDDLLRIVAYTVVLDAGVVLLGFSSLDPAGRDAVRAWLVPFVASRAALVGWVIAFRAGFGTARLSEARGWLRRAPALGVGLAAIGAATVGWPGVLVWDARLAALQAATAGPALLLATLASLGTAVAVARVLGTGLRPTAAPDRRRAGRAGARAGRPARRGPGPARSRRAARGDPARGIARGPAAARDEPHAAAGAPRRDPGGTRPDERRRGVRDPRGRRDAGPAGRGARHGRARRRRSRAAPIRERGRRPRAPGRRRPGGPRAGQPSGESTQRSTSRA